MLAFRRRRRPVRRRRLSHWQAAGLAAIALAVLAGAGYRVYLQWGSTPASPAQAIEAAASSSAAMTSASATFTTQVSGLTVMYGTVREESSPRRLATLAMTAVDGAVRFAVTEVVTSSRVYVGMPTLSAAVGRPWLGVPVAQLGADPAMAELYQTQALPSAEAGLLEFVSHARRAGHGVVRGESATRYVATVNPRTALARLSPALRALLAPELAATSGDISVTVWIGPHQDFSKIISSATVGGLRTVTTIVFTGANPAVHIRVPAARLVAAMPPAGLGTGQP